jgi:hypothetical protein
MGQVPPIHGFGDEIPHYFPVSPMYSTWAAGISTTAPLTEATIDEARLKTDQAYVKQVLDWILRHARDNFSAYQYAEAESYYNEYFQYLSYYRMNNLYGTPVNYIPALFERSWVNEIQGDEKEAQRLLNAELAKVLEVPVPSPGLPASLQVRLTALVIELAEHPELAPSPQLLKELAHVAEENHQPELAIRLLGQAQTLQYLEVYRTQRETARLMQETTGRPVPYSSLPFGYSHLGVPVAPILPQPADMMQRVSSKTRIDPHHIDRVDPIVALEKDPRDAEERRRRQRRKDKSAGNGKKPGKKPPMTI